ncbi:MAG TPA: peptidase M16, partial [Eggerthellaceae bacterium]|nr:peptidase M16 [Eggerthellaceae bacterium]
LSAGDIGDMPSYPDYGIDPAAPLACIRHTMPTHGIAYAYRYFDLQRLAFDDLPYVSVLSLVLGKLDTAKRNAAELDTLVQGKLGNLSFYSEVLENYADVDAVIPKFVVSASALSANVEWLADLPREVLIETDFSNTDKILDVLKQRKIGLEQHFANSGHSCAAARVKSYYSRAGVMREQLSNVEFYRFVCDTIEHYDERAEQLAARLEDVAKRLFCDDACTISFAGSDADYEAFWNAHPACGRTGADGRLLRIPEPVVRNEAFIVPSDVCYAALGWDRRRMGVSYTGAWAVAARALSLDYLWNEVRVKGGAYGVGFQVRPAGNMNFYSYRDPHLDVTLERFRKASSWLAEFDPSPADMDGFIVASVAAFDAPVKPRALMKRQAAEFFCGRTMQDRRRMRAQMVSADVEALRAFASVVESSNAHDARCVFGNRDILQSAKAAFEPIVLVG